MIITHSYVLNTYVSASQMWLLGRSMPLLIGSFVPSDDDYWKNFCKFLSITQLLFSPRLRENDLAVLQESIMSHHQKFAALYPSNSVIPKLHFLIHMPRLIYMQVNRSITLIVSNIFLALRYGPLVHQWCMRYEAKHKYFKTLIGNIGNFINAPYTLAMRHQYLQCYLHQEDQSTKDQAEFTKGEA